jgi:hypothetical protein
VRWTEFDQGIPLFGSIPDPTTQMVIGLVLGFVYILTGALILKVQSIGIWFGIAVIAFETMSILVSWRLWDVAVAGIVVARREFQELPVRAEEIEFMQRLLPEALLFALVAGFIILLGNARRFTP